MLGCPSCGKIRTWSCTCWGMTAKFPRISTRLRYKSDKIFKMGLRKEFFSPTEAFRRRSESGLASTLYRQQRRRRRRSVRERQVVSCQRFCVLWARRLFWTHARFRNSAPHKVCDYILKDWLVAHGKRVLTKSTCPGKGGASSYAHYHCQKV